MGLVLHNRWIDQCVLPSREGQVNCWSVQCSNLTVIENAVLIFRTTAFCLPLKSSAWRTILVGALPASCSLSWYEKIMGKKRKEYCKNWQRPPPIYCRKGKWFKVLSQKCTIHCQSFTITANIKLSTNVNVSVLIFICFLYCSNFG